MSDSSRWIHAWLKPPVLESVRDYARSDLPGMHIKLAAARLQTVSTCVAGAMREHLVLVVERAGKPSCLGSQRVGAPSPIDDDAAVRAALARCSPATALARAPLLPAPHPWDAGKRPPVYARDVVSVADSDRLRVVADKPPAGKPRGAAMAGVTSSAAPVPGSRAAAVAASGGAASAAAVVVHAGRHAAGAVSASPAGAADALPALLVDDDGFVIDNFGGLGDGFAFGAAGAAALAAGTVIASQAPVAAAAAGSPAHAPLLPEPAPQPAQPPVAAAGLPAAADDDDDDDDAVLLTQLRAVPAVVSSTEASSSASRSTDPAIGGASASSSALGPVEAHSAADRGAAPASPLQAVVDRLLSEQQRHEHAPAFSTPAAAGTSVGGLTPSSRSFPTSDNSSVRQRPPPGSVAVFDASQSQRSAQSAGSIGKPLPDRRDIEPDAASSLSQAAVHAVGSTISGQGAPSSHRDAGGFPSAGSLLDADHSVSHSPGAREDTSSPSASFMPTGAQPLLPFHATAASQFQGHARPSPHADAAAPPAAMDADASASMLDAAPARLARGPDARASINVAFASLPDMRNRTVLLGHASDGSGASGALTSPPPFMPTTTPFMQRRSAGAAGSTWKTPCFTSERAQDALLSLLSPPYTDKGARSGSDAGSDSGAAAVADFDQAMLRISPSQQQAHAASSGSGADVRGSIDRMPVPAIMAAEQALGPELVDEAARFPPSGSDVTLRTVAATIAGSVGAPSTDSLSAPSAASTATSQPAASAMGRTSAGGSASGSAVSSMEQRAESSAAASVEADARPASPVDQAMQRAVPPTSAAAAAPPCSDAELTAMAFAAAAIEAAALTFSQLTRRVGATSAAGSDADAASGSTSSSALPPNRTAVPASIASAGKHAHVTDGLPAAGSSSPRPATGDGVASPLNAAPPLVSLTSSDAPASAASSLGAAAPRGARQQPSCAAVLHGTRATVMHEATHMLFDALADVAASQRGFGRVVPVFSPQPARQGSAAPVAFDFGIPAPASMRASW